MQIVIDIPEEDYKVIKNMSVVVVGGMTIPNVFDAVRNGTPLPKGHGRLIDADVVTDGFEDNYELCIAVNATPTIIQADRG